MSTPIDVSYNVMSERMDQLDRPILISDSDAVDPAELAPFFVGWGWTPTAEARTALVSGSDIVVTARSGGTLIGIATALTDGGFFAYLSYLEVIPEFQGRGIGSLLVGRVVDLVRHQYDLALITDDGIVPFYEGNGFAHDVAGVHLRFLPRKRTH
jgi:GNAT superfamily N-acetyltransferase